MKTSFYLFLVGIFFIGILPVANAESVPDWVKNTAGWWAEDVISETEFVNAIEYLIKDGIIVVSSIQQSESQTDGIPDWVKNTAGWWADGLIDDKSFVTAIQWLISNSIIIVEKEMISTEEDFLVAFIGDQGANSGSIAVLNLIKDEGAQLVIHQGDYDTTTVQGREKHQDDPDAWDKMISDVLGNNFPYFGTIGHHDGKKWDGYQEKFYDRLQKNPDVECIGELGVKSSCTYKGLFFIQTSPGLKGAGHSSFIENQLHNNEHKWRICTWSKQMQNIQVGDKADIAGWEVYENCKNGGAIIATAHHHAYSRTKTLIDIEQQIVDPDWSNPNKLRIKEGSTFVFVSGLAGAVIKDQERCLPTSYPYGCNEEWAKIYTSSQNAKYGALFCTFNVGGDENRADCYFKNIDGEIIDEFTITNFVGINNFNSDLTNTILTDNDLSNTDLTETILIGADLTNANLANADLSGKYLSDTILLKADMSNANLYGVDLSNTDLSETILSGVDLSNTDLSETILYGADLSNTKLGDFDFKGRDLTFSILSGLDLSNTDLSETILYGADLSNTKLGDFDFKGRNLNEIKLGFQDLSNTDFSQTSLDESSFTGSNLSNTDFSLASLVNVDFREINNKDLKNANFTNASLAYSNLSSVNLDQVDFTETNLSTTKMSDTDFSNIYGKKLYGSIFSRANLENSNFNGISFFDNQLHSFTLPNSPESLSWAEDFFNNSANPSFWTREFIKSEIRENDLIVTYIIHNNFSETHLVNSNFSNSNLSYAIFNNANLTGADFTRANLTGANLTGANLTGANLTDIILKNTILSCINHEICN